MNIEQIKIVIKTAIPEKKPFELKSSMIYINDPDEKLGKLNEYPFITSTHEFNKSAMQTYLYVNGYSKIVRFFFNKREFGKLFTQFTIDNSSATSPPSAPSSTPSAPPSAPSSTPPTASSSTPTTVSSPSSTPPSTSSPIKTSVPVDSGKILTTNVKIMLELLFPMAFPALLNVTNSFDLYIKQNSDFDLNTVFSNVSKNFFKRFAATIQSMKVYDYSYLKVDGVVYTVTKVIWLNDLLNHPEYREFIDEFIGFKQLAKEQQDTLEKTIRDKTALLFEKIQSRPTARNSLNIYEGYIVNFLKNVEPNRSKNQRYDSQKLETFNGDLQKILLLLVDVANLHRNLNIETTPTPISDIKSLITTFVTYTPPSPTPVSTSTSSSSPTQPNPPTEPKITIGDEKTKQDNYLSELATIMNDINEIYKRLKENSAGTLTGIPKTFSTNVSNIIDEIQAITTNKIIKEKYLSENANINLEGEDPGVVAELTKNFPTYITFSNKIKTLLPPERITTNESLQNKIIDYSKGKNDNTDTSFDKIMSAIQEQFILMTNTPNSSSKLPDLNDQSIQPLLNTEVCVLDKRKQNAPHYEIYVALNLIEGEINSSNLNAIKCVYRSMYLGKEVQNYFTKYNKYDIDQHLFYLSQKTIKNEPSENAETAVPQPPPPPPQSTDAPTPPASGGNNRKTHKIIYKRSRKTLRK